MDKLVDISCDIAFQSLAGPCSNTSGILMSSEIAAVLQDAPIQLISDQANAVNYAVWDLSVFLLYAK